MQNFKQLLCLEYYGEGDTRLGNEFAALVKKVSSSYDTLDVFIQRAKVYNPAGRFQTEAESDEISKTLMAFLKDNGVDTLACPGSIEGYDSLVSLILDVLKRQ